jgi:hypothetical protein
MTAEEPIEASLVPSADRSLPPSFGSPRPSGNGSTPPSREQLRREIAETRTDLADTLAALVAKGDVKARVGDELAHLRYRAVENVHRRPVLLMAAAGALVAAVVGAILWQQTRRGGRR